MILMSFDSYSDNILTEKYKVYTVRHKLSITLKLFWRCLLHKNNFITVFGKIAAHSAYDMFHGIRT